MMLNVSRFVITIEDVRIHPFFGVSLFLTIDVFGSIIRYPILKVLPGLAEEDGILVLVWTYYINRVKLWGRQKIRVV